MRKTELSGYFAVIALTFILVTGCGSGGTELPPQTAHQRLWTVMVYLDADNNLDSYAIGDLLEMLAVGSTSQVSILVQKDGLGTPAYRYYLKQGSLETLASLGEVNTASPATLTDFIKFGITSYPAQHYLLVIWDHGIGWKDSNALAKRVNSVLVDWDNNGRNSAMLSNSAVAQAIAAAEQYTGVKLDILAFDACNMATIEAAYAFRDSARILVASQELEAVTGWDYKDALGRLIANPTQTSEQYAQALVASYRTSSEASGATNQTMSALYLGIPLVTVAQAVDRMARELSAGLVDQARQADVVSRITAARASVQEFETVYYPFTSVDLGDLSNLLLGSGNYVQTALQATILAEYHGAQRTDASGLSLAFFDIPKLYEIYHAGGPNLFDPIYVKPDGKTPQPFLDTYFWDELLRSYYLTAYPQQYAALGGF